MLLEDVFQEEEGGKKPKVAVDKRKAKPEELELGDGKFVDPIEARTHGPAFLISLVSFDT